ncbi:unnamed protein product [Lactuca saligna]|uniref:Uncharacterized protein n=1 Tax=Lactuca saligna TaxID=75948 RepID=A0AA36E4L7_LACSI|nr:unnamed protein product [Lactuca saligna]
MYETRKAKTNLQKEIVPAVDEMNDDQPILYIGDQSEIDDYEGCIEIGFMPQVVLVVLLNVVYPDSYFEWKASSSGGGGYETEVGNSAAGDSSAPYPSKNRLSHYELERGYCVPIYLELSRRLDKLQINEFRRVKLEILKETEKFYNGSSNESEEED